MTARTRHLNANNDVTVTSTDGTGATNDSITVTERNVHLPIRLASTFGSNAYVSGGSIARNRQHDRGHPQSRRSDARHTGVTITPGRARVDRHRSTTSSRAPIYTPSSDREHASRSAQRHVVDHSVSHLVRRRRHHTPAAELRLVECSEPRGVPAVGDLARHRVCMPSWSHARARRHDEHHSHRRC